MIWRKPTVAYNKEKPKAVKMEPIKEPLQEAVIYVGPSVGSQLMTNQVYIGGIPTHLLELKNTIPFIESLFVPVSSYAESVKAVGTEGTALNALYIRAKEALQHGV